jgi:hypothetical protein
MDLLLFMRSVRQHQHLFQYKIQHHVDMLLQYKLVQHLAEVILVGLDVAVEVKHEQGHVLGLIALRIHSQIQEHAALHPADLGALGLVVLVDNPEPGLALDQTVQHIQKQKQDALVIAQHPVVLAIQGLGEAVQLRLVLQTARLQQALLPKPASLYAIIFLWIRIMK